MATIGLEEITKVYPNGFEAVHGINLDVADGEFMVLVGPSGCGKTTVLRMVAGLEEISSGTLRIGGHVVNELGPKERDIAMVFQNYALYPHMTVRENVGFALKLRKLPKAEIDAKVEDAAHILGLTEWLDRKPAQLSGGQRQRVAMGRAIVREPTVFLMDEPLSNLDAKLRVQMRLEVLRIQHRVDVATLYVTHDQIEAMTMGDRVAVMRAGSVEQTDSPQVLYDHPTNLFVGAFIGSPSMNLYEAVVGDGARSLRLGSQEIQLRDRVAVAHPGLASYSGRKVVIGLRPEHLPAAGPDDVSLLEGDVDLVEALGSELLVHFSIDAQRVTTEGITEEEEQLTARGAGVARVDPRTPMKTGKRARFAVDVDEMLFFDAETEHAIWD
ncbi:MAG: ABC transporter ATP-binding protein [Solirubrobacteraceae bacterium]